MMLTLRPTGKDSVHLNSSMMRTLRFLSVLDLKIYMESQPKGKTSQEIGDIIILEQYLRMLSPELQVWIRDHSPFSMVKASELAEVFVAARKKGQPWTCHANKIKKGPKSAEMYHQRPVSADKTPVGDNHSAGRPLKNFKKDILLPLWVKGPHKANVPKNLS